MLAIPNPPPRFPHSPVKNPAARTPNLCAGPALSALPTLGAGGWGWAGSGQAIAQALGGSDAGMAGAATPSGECPRQAEMVRPMASLRRREPQGAWRLAPATYRTPWYPWHAPRQQRVVQLCLRASSPSRGRAAQGVGWSLGVVMGRGVAGVKPLPAHRTYGVESSDALL
jgi:hypothetical protein